jgi:hypothetical protein
MGGAGDGAGSQSGVKVDVEGGKAQVSADGTVTIPQGATADMAVGRSVSVKAPGGTTIARDGTVRLPQGEKADIGLGRAAVVEAPGGTTIAPDGTISIPAGAGGATVRLPDGTSLRVPQGNIIFEDPDLPLGFAYRYENPFIDVSDGDWAYDAVQHAVESELFNGTSPDTFSPDSEMTRAMIVTVLYRLEGQPGVSGSSPFDDVEGGQWYSDAIAWGAANGIVKGFSESRFGGGEPVTREQIAAILQRYAAHKGKDTGDGADIGAFADAAAVSGYALGSVRWAVGAGLIQGHDTNELAPQDDAARAEVAAIMQRYMELG